MSIFLLNLIVPFVMILVAAILKKHPVTDMTSQNGYNTPASRRSQEHWDYAQRTAPDIFLSTGKALLILEILLSILLSFLKTGRTPAVTAGLIIGFLFLISAFCRTEKSIRNFKPYDPLS